MAGILGCLGHGAPVWPQGFQGAADGVANYCPGVHEGGKAPPDLEHTDAKALAPYQAQGPAGFKANAAASEAVLAVEQPSRRSCCSL